MSYKKKAKTSAGEFGLIARILACGGGQSPALVLGAGDDAAVWRPSEGFDSLFTSDLLVEDVHFSLKTISAWQLGARALAASLSDIAAMGGLPRVFLSAMAVPKRKKLNEDFFEAYAAGAKAWGDSFGAVLAGGDLSRSPGPLMLDIHLVGEIERGKALTRSGAQAGDWLLCSGNPGDSAAGLALLSERGVKKRKLDPALLAVLTKKHLTPLPRVLAGRWLSTHRAASSCLDISDGIASEAEHLALSSGVGVEIDVDALPCSAAALSAGKTLRKSPAAWALSGGEDYELLFTVNPKKMKVVMERLSLETGTPIRVIGKVTRRRGLSVRKKGKLKPLKVRGYRHF